MHFHITKHAQEEMDRRNIPLEVLESVLHYPQQIVLDSSGDKVVYQSQVDFDGKWFLVRVVVVDDVYPAIVVTVYRTSQIRKYWRTS
jgi:hypothetical protein